MHRLKVVVACSVIAMAGLPAVAQEDKPTPQPSETTETFGSWTVRCQKPSAQAPRTCEVLHTVQSQGNLIVQIAVGTPTGKETPLIVVQTPLGVLVSQPVAILKAQSGEPQLSVSFQTCLQIGCLAQLDIDHETLDGLASGQAAKLAFAERTGRSVEITIPLNGMSDALTRLRQG